MNEVMLKKGHPKGLYLLFATEMWERFSYYGMRAILSLYMVNALAFSKAQSSNIYGSYTGLVFLTPLIGGYVSDRYWGNRRSIVVGGLLMAMGQFLCFFSGSLFSNNLSLARILLYAGLLGLIIGNGFFKPNISSMVGQLYPKSDKRLDAAFTIFYLGINLGAFIGMSVCGILGERYDAQHNNLPEYFKYGFLAAGIGMILGVFLFSVLKNKFLLTPEGHPIGGKPSLKIKTATQPAKPVNYKVATVWAVLFAILITLFKTAWGFDWIGSFIFSAAIAVSGFIISDPSLSREERARIWVIYIVSFFVIFFWAAFEQAGVSLTFFAAEQTDRHLFGWEMPASIVQNANSLAIILFAPLFSWLWSKLATRNADPPAPFKQAMGLLWLALGYLVIALAVKNIQPGMKVSVLFLMVMYMLHTWGELSLSPIGLSLVSKLAPLRFSSLLMGVWFISNAAGNKFAGTLSALYPPGEGEFKKAAGAGIDLPAILNGKMQATAAQLARLKELGIGDHYPTLLGIQITNLYHFFLIFVIMAGVAAVILFLLSRRLLKMMHGVK